MRGSTTKVINAGVDRITQNLLYLLSTPFLASIEAFRIEVLDNLFHSKRRFATNSFIEVEDFAVSATLFL